MAPFQRKLFIFFVSPDQEEKKKYYLEVTAWHKGHERGESERNTDAKEGKEQTQGRKPEDKD
jgi:hypothetical protein